MASDAQIAANRRNAAKSTGPRTTEGKAAVSQNALKHGLLARDAVIKGEDPGQFEFYRDRMLGELAPVGMMESVLAERAVGLSWRLRRAERVQNDVFDALFARETESPLAKLSHSLLASGTGPSKGDISTGKDDLTLGRVVIKDFANSRVLDRLLMYERRIGSSLFRTMRELQRLRLVRELEPASRAGDGDVSGAGRMPRRFAARNDRPKYGPGRAASGYGSADAWREYEMRREAEKKAECDRLLEYSAAQRNRGAAESNRAKQSQSAAVASPSAAVQNRDGGAGCADGRYAADNCAKQSQSGTVPTNPRRDDGVCEAVSSG
jgi:hypothetical protein